MIHQDVSGVDVSHTRLWLGPRSNTPFAEDPSLTTHDSRYSQDSAQGTWPTLAWTTGHRLHDIKTLCSTCSALDVAVLADGGPPVKLFHDFRDIQKTAGRCRLCALLAQSGRGIQGVHYQTDFLRQLGSGDMVRGHLIVEKQDGRLLFYATPPGFPWKQILLASWLTMVSIEGVVTEPSISGATSPNHDVSAETRDVLLRKELQRTSTAAAWCSTCAPENIPLDEGRPDEPPLPYRIIEILSPFGTPESLIQLRLKTSEHTEHALYATLSHRWGGSFTLKTTKRTLSARTKGFCLSDLPRTFQDAVLVTAAVGLRYVWIDSLCIVQDDKKEWLDQSAKMGAIYMNSSFTIAAHSASQCNEGFLWRSQVPRTLHIPSRPGGFSLSLPPLSGPQLRRRLFEGDIARRAWVMQELSLSPRILHFVEDHVFWECRHACGLPPPRPKAEIEFTFEGMHPLPRETSAEIFHTARSTLTTHSAWLALVQRYSEYQMTNAGDKLIAISGVANVLRLVDGGPDEIQDQGHGCPDYHYGAFTADMDRSLLWFSAAYGSETFEPNLDRAPSWSWASCETTFRFAVLDLEKNKDAGGYEEEEFRSMLRFRSVQHHDNTRTRVNSAVPHLRRILRTWQRLAAFVNKDPWPLSFNLCSPSRLVVEAPIFHIPSTLCPVPRKTFRTRLELPNFVLGLERGPGLRSFGWFVPDMISGSILHTYSLSFIAVRGFVVKGELVGAYCLVAARIDEGASLYGRIGMGYVYAGDDDIKKAMLAGPEVITLV